MWELEVILGTWCTSDLLRARQSDHDRSMESYRIAPRLRIIKRKIVVPIRLEFQDIFKPEIEAGPPVYTYISFRVSEAEREGIREFRETRVRSSCDNHLWTSTAVIMSTWLSSIEIWFENVARSRDTQRNVSVGNLCVQDQSRAS